MVSNSLSLKDFAGLINNMPVNYQAFSSKKETWEKFSLPEINEIFGENNEVKLSRKDIKDIAISGDLKKTVIATIIWGYPRGMRGNHFKNIINNMAPLIELLSDAKNNNISNWKDHYEKVKKVESIGLSTYTKFLYFLSAHAERFPALILDKRITDVIAQEVFIELDLNQKINYTNAPNNYLYYLELLNNEAKKIGTTAEKLELFLFQFGLNLK